MSMHTLAEIDQDGALQESMEAVAGDTRASFMRKSTIAAGGLLGGGAVLGLLPGVASAASKGDVAILNYALTLEYLESSFYHSALKHSGLKGKVRRLATEIAGHEDTHVTALRKALGSKAVSRPKFNFGAATRSGVSTFLATAVKLEDTGVSAYKGQAPLIDSTAILKSALAIHTVEAKHAAWVRRTAGLSPTIGATDPPLSMATVLGAVKATGFIIG